MSTRNKIYFASDFHLGVPDHATSLDRERRVVRWLDEVSKDASDIYLVGDLFDFWFEFGTVVPKGFTRLLGKMSEIADKGINLHVFHGNHDLWMFGYFEKEIGCKVYPRAITIDLLGKKFHIAHGDGVGPGQFGFKFLLGIYRNYFFQRLFAFFHPNIGLTISHWFSNRNKQQGYAKDKVYLGDDKEYLMLYAKEQLQKDSTIDYFIMGHRHFPFDKKIGETHVINLGDWMGYNTYVVYDGKTVELKTYEG